MKKLCFVSLLTLSILSTNAQSNLDQFLPAVATHSPDMGSLFKFTGYPVNYYTGVPDISIPIYEIKVGEISIPIKISYHAGGIKLTENSSWVGLGWALQTGASISRRTMGQPDEYTGNYFSGGTVKQESDFSNEPDWVYYLRNVGNGNIDAEPDIFTYSIPGGTGRFLYNQKNNLNIVLMPYEPVKIVKRDYPIHFDIITDAGVTYKFDTAELSTSFSSGNSQSARSSWPVTKVVSANKQDTVYYTYTNIGSVQVQSENNLVLSVTDNISYPLPGHTGSLAPNPGSLTSIPQTSSSDILKLTEIKFRNGKLVFEKDVTNRLDLADQALKSISIMSYDEVSGTYSLLKKFRFYQSYFINGTDNNSRRLRLDSVKIEDKNGVAMETYKFEYNSLTLPAKTSWARDYWSYYNGKSNDLLIPRMQIDYTVSGVNNPITVGSSVTNSREVDPAYAQACILKKIFYPTGGRTEFEFESNKYTDGLNIKYAGGLRIRSIKSYDSSGNPPLVKTYTYGPNESGNGTALFALTNYFFQTTQTLHEYADIGTITTAEVATGRLRTFIGNSFIDLEPYEGAPVGYSVVTEYEGDSASNIGKTAYMFSNHAEEAIGVGILIGKPAANPYFMNRAQLLNRTVYKRNPDGTYTSVSVLSNSYEAFPESQYNDIGFVSAHMHIYTGPGSYGDHPHDYIYQGYPGRSDDDKLTQTTERLYDQSNPSKFTETTTNYYYENFNHQQITKITSISSKGDSLITKRMYPHDFSATSPYNTMITLNNINKVVKEKKFKNTTLLSTQVNNYLDKGNGNYVPATVDFGLYNNTLETRASINTYDAKANVVEMQKVNDFRQSYIWDRRNTYLIAEVKKAASTDIAYTSFEGDANGGWTIASALRDTGFVTGKKSYKVSNGSISRSGLNSSTTYVISYWTKNGTAYSITGNITGYPITGKTINGWTYVEHKITGVTSVAISGSGNIDELRLYPDGALMTTYTYDPLIGMTSQCDVNNRVTYYEFDGMQRLKMVRDQDRNVIKTIQYYTVSQGQALP